MLQLRGQVQEMTLQFNLKSTGPTSVVSTSNTNYFWLEWKINDFLLRCTGHELRTPVECEFDDRGIVSSLLGQRQLGGVLTPRSTSVWKIKLVPYQSEPNVPFAAFGHRFATLGLPAAGNVNNYFKITLTLLEQPARWVIYKFSITNKSAPAQSVGNLFHEESAVVKYPNQSVASFSRRQMLSSPSQSVAVDQGAPIVFESNVAELVSQHQEFGPKSHIIEIDQIPKFLNPDGSLTISCELKTLSAVVNTADDPLNASKYEFGSKLKALLQNDREQFSDVTLISGMKKFKAHRVILAACSKVFASTFQSSVEETMFSVNDIQPDVVEEMLTYIYTGETPKMNDMAMAEHLLYAANKFQLDHLQKLCEQALVRTLTVNNVAKRLQLAKNCNGELLKKNCFQTISKNWKDFVSTPEWQQIKQDTELASEIFEAISTLL